MKTRKEIEDIWKELLDDDPYLYCFVIDGRIVTYNEFIEESCRRSERLEKERKEHERNKKNKN